MSCPLCDDTGWKPIDRDGTRRVVRCDCWREGLTARLLDDARIPPRYRKCDLETFVTYPNEKLLNAVKQARKFAEDFPAPRKGLRVIRSTYNPLVRTAEMDVLRPVMEADLLVLDDIGSEKTSEWVEETMNLIVNTRYNERRHTIFTSNYEDTPEDASTESQEFTLKERIGFRIHSRLHEMCEFLEFDGADYRHAPTNAGADDLLALWKRKGPNGGKRTLPSRAKGPIRAHIKQPEPKGKDLGWSGGKAGT